MAGLLRLSFATLSRVFCARQVLLIEDFVLRQQLAVFKHQHSRSILAAIEKLFWVWLRLCYAAWKSLLVLASPDTVVRWHRAGFVGGNCLTISGVCVSLGRNRRIATVQPLSVNVLHELATP